MKGDFTRDTFDPLKHFSRVLMQQGRVQLDADWNEQAAILLHYLQALARDLIGPHGTPANDDGSAGSGFTITSLVVNGQAVANDFAIQAGHYYVDGILAENDSDTHYAGQADYVLDDSGTITDGTFLVYLDVWERHVTSLEDDSIREVALGGPDTATRAEVVWQVKIWPADSGLISNLKDYLTDPSKYPNYTTAWNSLVGQWQPSNRGWLQAMLEPLDDGTADPCITPPQSGYRGAENQLYRVEIHTGGAPDQATFKWSRNNGSVATEWKDTQGADLVVGSVRGFTAGQWVELIDDMRELRGQRGTLVKLVKVEGDTLTMDPTSTQESTDWPSTSANPRIIGWDQQETDSLQLSSADNAIPVQEGTTIALEDGIQIQFAAGSTSDNQYRTGDYWLIPARTATGSIEWPTVEDTQGNSIPAALPPNGIEHHYAPLWGITVIGGTVFADPNATSNPGFDLRRQLKPIWML